MSAAQVCTTAIHVPSIGASTADVLHVCHGQDDEWYVEAAYYVPSTADAADASNYTTITLLAGAAGTAFTDTAMANTTIAFVAGTVRAFAFTGADTLREFGPTDSVEINKAETGTGGILHGAIVIRWVKRRV